MTERPLHPNELELLAHLLTKVEVTSENLPVIRLEIAEIREHWGLKNEALEAIRRVRKGTEKIGAHEDVVDLFWEEYLIGIHLVMKARDKEGLWSLPLKAAGIANGYTLMRSSAQDAQKYIEKHNVESKRARSGRYLGGVAVMEKRYKKAAEYFSHSAALFGEMKNWSDRVNRLELLGFLAEGLILSGKAGEGLEIAKQTFKGYDEGDGVKLRQEDYYTWAVWKSGCVIKAWHAVFARGVILDKETQEEFLVMLDEADRITEIPEGVETWGDRSFTGRKNEIAAIRRQLSPN